MYRKTKRKFKHYDGSVMVNAVKGWEWLPPFIDKLSDRHGISRAELFRRAFCEAYAPEDSALKKLYQQYCAVCKESSL